MSNYLRTAGYFCKGLIGAILLIFVINTISSIVSSSDRIKENIKLSYRMGELEPYRFMNKDNFTECSIITMQIVRHDSYLPDIVDTRLSVSGDNHPCEDLASIAGEPGARSISLGEPASYVNYWFGSRYLSGLFLNFTDVGALRTMYLIISYASVLLLIFSAWKRSKRIATVMVPIGISLIFAFGLHNFGENIAHAPGYIAGFLLISYFIYSRRFSNAETRVSFFSFLGGIICYFDMLHGSIPVMLSLTIISNHFLFVNSDISIPGNTPRSRAYASEAFYEALRVFFFIALAILFVYLFKMVVLLMINKHNYFAQVLAQLRFRMGTSVGTSVPINTSDVFRGLWFVRDRLTHGRSLAEIFLFGSLVSWCLSLIGMAAIMKKKRDANIVVTDILVLFATAVGVLGWYIMFKNHSYIHKLFSIRISSVVASLGFSAIALLTVFYYRNFLKPRLDLPNSSNHRIFTVFFLIVTILSLTSIFTSIRERNIPVLNGEAVFLKDYGVDKVTPSHTGLRKDGIADGVIRIDLSPATLDGGLIHDIVGANENVLISLERSSPMGLWSTSYNSYVLGISLTESGPLINNRDGSVNVPIKKKTRLFAYYGQDGYDTVNSIYTLKINGREIDLRNDSQ